MCRASEHCRDGGGGKNLHFRVSYLVCQRANALKASAATMKGVSGAVGGICAAQDDRGCSRPGHEYPREQHHQHPNSGQRGYDGDQDPAVKKSLEKAAKEEVRSMSSLVEKILVD
jgi:hypothetical protein